VPQLFAREKKASGTRRGTSVAQTQLTAR
jgi:hypothetical protein